MPTSNLAVNQAAGMMEGFCMSPAIDYSTVFVRNTFVRRTNVQYLDTFTSGQKT